MRTGCAATEIPPFLGLDLNQKQMKNLLKRAGICWHGWHRFRRWLASNLNRLGVDDSEVLGVFLKARLVMVRQRHDLFAHWRLGMAGTFV